MEAPRGVEPSGTNRPSSSFAIFPEDPSGAVTLCGPEGTATRPARQQQNAPWRPAAMAGEAHPDPSRTRKLSPRAPMVLRSSPWESRTSLTNKGHFLVEGLRALFCI